MFRWCRGAKACMRRTGRRTPPLFIMERRSISSDGNQAPTQNHLRGSQHKCGKAFRTATTPCRRKMAFMDLTIADPIIVDSPVTTPEGTMFPGPAIPMHALEAALLLAAQALAARTMLPARTLRYRPTTARKMLVGEWAIQAGGPLDRVLQMAGTALPEQMFPAARMLPSTARRARRMVARSGTITFLVPQTAALRKTPIAEGGRDLLRNHI